MNWGLWTGKSVRVNRNLELSEVVTLRWKKNWDRRKKLELSGNSSFKASLSEQVSTVFFLRVADMLSKTEALCDLLCDYCVSTACLAWLVRIFNGVYSVTGCGESSPFTLNLPRRRPKGARQRPLIQFVPEVVRTLAPGEKSDALLTKLHRSYLMFRYMEKLNSISFGRCITYSSTGYDEY